MITFLIITLLFLIILTLYSCARIISISDKKTDDLQQEQFLKNYKEHHTNQ